MENQPDLWRIIFTLISRNASERLLRQLPDVCPPNEGFRAPEGASKSRLRLWDQPLVLFCWSPSNRPVPLSAASSHPRTVYNCTVLSPFFCPTSNHGANWFELSRGRGRSSLWRWFSVCIRGRLFRSCGRSKRYSLDTFVRNCSREKKKDASRQEGRKRHFRRRRSSIESTRNTI